MNKTFKLKIFIHLLLLLKLQPDPIIMPVCTPTMYGIMDDILEDLLDSSLVQFSSVSCITT